MIDLYDRMITEHNPQLNDYYISDIQEHHYYNDFEFTPDNVYNGLKAGPWIQPDYVGKKQINEFLRNGKISSVFFYCAILILIMSFIGFNVFKSNPLKGLLVMFILSLIISAFVILFNYFHYTSLKYNIDNAVLIKTSHLMKSCNLEQMQYKPDYIYAETDNGGFRLKRTEYNLNCIIFNNDDNKKWYCVYNAKPSNTSVEGTQGLVLKSHARIDVNQYEIIIIETCRGQARLLIPDEPIVSYTIADGMGSLPTESTIIYDGSSSVAWFSDSFNDLNRNGIEDDREKKHNNLIGMVNNNDNKDATAFTL